MQECHFVEQFLCNYQKGEAGQTPPVPPPSPPSAGGGHACGHASAVRRLVRSPEVQNNLEMNHGVCMLYTSSKLLTTTEWRPWIDASLSHHAPVPHAYFLSPFAHPPLTNPPSIPHLTPLLFSTRPSSGYFCDFHGETDYFPELFESANCSLSPKPASLHPALTCWRLSITVPSRGNECLGRDRTAVAR